MAEDNAAAAVAEVTDLIAKMLGESAPKLGELVTDVLLGDIWERPGLSARDRSLITITALTVEYRPDALAPYLQRALASGLTKEELGEAITHIAFYGGFPNAIGAAMHLKAVLDGEQQPLPQGI
ncbi:carboxymuconolactone decarboxylase family protein [Streptomyces niveus]|uniref:carboxymuconolactone decarboxylase family protein n=1 Tax=Streptomyces niveus TaxID=193462 RepID=UPI0036D3B987